ncbi:MAG: alginate export family protein, partial [Proteobacteria bacterium]|nr:alginate export family protein [Pseudomonadota bacterium]
MKKLVGLSLAAALFAASTAPAIAADVELSGEVRVRHEIMDNYDYNDNVGDSANATTQRTRINFKASVDDRTTAFISLQDTRTHGEEASTADTAAENQGIDLSQGYLLIDDLIPSTDLLIGRFPLAYGNQRYVGAFEWSDNARRFDGLAFLYGSELVDIHLALTQVGIGGAGVEDTHVNALETMWKTLIPKNQLDAYLIQITGAGGMEIQTLGLRLDGKAAGADWTAEYIQEGGDAATGIDQDATALAITGGYTIPGPKIRIGAEFTSGSGDDATTTDNEAFTGGLPTNKFHYGLSGRGGAWSNRDNISLNVTAKPADGMKVRAEYWDYTVNEVAAGASDDVGSEINLQFWYSLTEKTKLHAHIAQFAPGEALVGAAGPDDAATLISLQL